MTALGQTRWAIAEGYIPGQSSFSDPALVSHETACILHAGDRSAHVHFLATASRSGHTSSPSRRGARCTCVSTISSGPNRFRATRPTRHYSNQMYRSWCSTRGSFRDTLKSVCCRRPPMPRRRASTPHLLQCALAAIPATNPAISGVLRARHHKSGTNFRHPG